MTCIPTTRSIFSLSTATKCLRRLIPVLLVCCGTLLGACEKQPEATPVDLSKRIPTEELQPRGPLKDVIHLGLGAMITPREGMTYYRRLIEHLEGRLGTPIQVIDKGSYQEFNALLKKGELDVAFICSGSYVEGHEEFGLELLVVPVTPSGEAIYYSYLVVPTDSEVTGLADLKGKRFAYTDPMSNSGKLSPDYQIRLLNEEPESFFSETIYTYAHDRSVDAVMAGLVDGAAIDSLIYDYLARINPEVPAKTKVVARSEPYGIPPVVVRPGLPQDLRERLKKAFLQLHETPEGAEILEGMMLERFVEGHDADYDTIRRMCETTTFSDEE